MFYQYYAKYFAEEEEVEEEVEGIVCAKSFIEALEQIITLYDEILSVELTDLGFCLEKDMIDKLVWRTDNDYTVIEDCDSCKI